MRQLEAEHTFLKRPETPEDRHKQIEALADDLKQTKETVALQNEDIERMQNLLQNKDDEIDKLREALDEEEEGDVVRFSLLNCFYQCLCQSSQS